MNLLTDEECEIVKKLSEKPELTLTHACHGYKYFGIDRDANIEDIKVLEAILSKWCPDLISFSNFTGTTPNKIRIQASYDVSFIGVHYLDMPSNEEES